MSNQPGYRETAIVVMSCLHTAVFVKPTPRIGEYAFCYKCDAYKKAVIRPNAYRLECRDCTKLRQTDYGSAKLRCEIAADRHARKMRGHRVVVYNGDEFVSEQMHTPDPTLEDAPPF